MGATISVYSTTRKGFLLSGVFEPTKYTIFPEVEAKFSFTLKHSF